MDSGNVKFTRTDVSEDRVVDRSRRGCFDRVCTLCTNHGESTLLRYIILWRPAGPGESLGSYNRGDVGAQLTEPLLNCLTSLSLSAGSRSPQINGALKYRGASNLPLSFHILIRWKCCPVDVNSSPTVCIPISFTWDHPANRSYQRSSHFWHIRHFGFKYKNWH